MRNIQILGTGVALPSRKVTSEEIDQKMGYKKGYTEKLTGMSSRYYVTNETASDLACESIKHAIKHSPLKSLDEIDCIISASGTTEQAIPYNAVLIHSKLNLSKTIPAFDVDMTCLSALMAFDLAANMLSLGQYEKILVVSSEVPSVGVDWVNIETGGIFGDGAAAVILSSSKDSSQGVLASYFETHSEGVELCVMKGGGTRFHPGNVDGDYVKYAMFEMQGKEVYKLAARHINKFMQILLEKSSLTIDMIDWVVPHQASNKALTYFTKILKLNSKKVISILSTRGNQVAASIPSTLHELITHYPVKKGDKVLLLGTSAGLSLGGMVIEI